MIQDGTIRKARGTLMKDVIPETKGTGNHLAEHLQLYYDLDKKSYKCFTKSKLLTIEKD